ncbi:hypothetical protein [Streptomyces celluloflavus]|uniref:hypothetical protein n=1 Tax=Streptomyces celluloflavus TaxID=58344 RepID=UPI00369F1C0A
MRLVLPDAGVTALRVGRTGRRVPPPCPELPSQGSELSAPLPQRADRHPPSRRHRFGNRTWVGIAASTWSAAVPAPASPKPHQSHDRFPAAAATKADEPVSGWCPEVFFQATEASCFPERARTPPALRRPAPGAERL